MARNLDRRSVICGGCAAMVAACTPRAPVGSPTGSTGETGDTGDGTAQTSDASPCEQQVVEPGGAGWTALPLADYPDLAEVGGWYGVTAGGRSLVVAHAFEGCYVAIERACAHEGEPIDYVPSRAQFVCPRHGAIYDLQGDKVAGPQPTGLAVFPCGRDGDTVWVLA
jgi:nitrite reductase/ring-hydroxylating ferredoxin subunit